MNDYDIFKAIRGNRDLAFRVEQYEIDGPHTLRLLKWQEMS